MAALTIATEHPSSCRQIIIVHPIEEYARQCGHADFLRKAIDGTTGDCRNALP